LERQEGWGVSAQVPKACGCGTKEHEHREEDVTLQIGNEKQKNGGGHAISYEQGWEVGASRPKEEKKNGLNQSTGHANHERDLVKTSAEQWGGGKRKKQCKIVWEEDGRGEKPIEGQEKTKAPNQRGGRGREGSGKEAGFLSIWGEPRKLTSGRHWFLGEERQQKEGIARSRERAVANLKKECMFPR